MTENILSVTNKFKREIQTLSKTINQFQKHETFLNSKKYNENKLHDTSKQLKDQETYFDMLHESLMICDRLRKLSQRIKKKIKKYTDILNRFHLEMNDRKQSIGNKLNSILDEMKKYL